MNLAAVDLNLLVAFEALYLTRNVTQAGQRIGRAQPSVSNALGRLRALFGDELFVRSRDGMLPTARAQALMPQIGAALDQLRQALQAGRPFDPASARLRFTLAASDYAQLVFVPALLAHLRVAAPHVDLRVARLDRGRYAGELDRGDVDMVVGGHLAAPKRLTVDKLYAERFVCITDRDNPAADAPATDTPAPRRRLTLDTYLRLPHALFAPGDDGSARGIVDEHLAAIGRQRRVVATFTHIAAIPLAVRGTDLVATLAERAALALGHPQLAIHPLPRGLQAPPFDIELVSGARARGDAALGWLRHRIVAVGRAMGRAPRS